MLFSILQGPSSRIDTTTTPLHEGWAYFTPDTSGFYIDAKVDGDLQRIQINPDEVFQAVKNETTYAEIAAAYNRGNTVLCIDGAAVCQLSCINEASKNALFVSIYRVDADSVAHIRAWNVSEGEDGTTTWTRHAKVTTESVVNSVVELNHSAEQKFWRGTKEEYDAIDVKDDSVLYIVTDENNEAVAGVGVQSDYSVNDETDPAYIKNRPCYSMVTTDTILEETGLVLTSGQAMIDVDLNLEIGKEYIVKWNGTEYHCIGQAYDGGGVALGDFGPMTGGTSTGEPFALLWVYPEMQSSVGGMKTAVMAVSGGSSATISIISQAEAIQKLDAKYIPDSVVDQAVLEAKTYTDEQIEAIPNEISVFAAIIGTTWETDTSTGAKTQFVDVPGVSETDTASVDCVYDGDYTSESYATFVEQKNQFLTKITNGFSETVNNGIKFTIFGNANTVNIPIVVEAIHHDMIYPYLTFSSPEPFSIRVASPGWDGTMEYSTDRSTWNTWDGSTISSTALYLRGTGNTKVTGSDSGSYKWTLTGSNIACTGNIENLLDYQTVAAGNHPAMANYCYDSMFYGCTSLTVAPELPATTLAESCYACMFYGCTSLTVAPALPATTLANHCYDSMFRNCTGLTTAPELPATTLADYCYYSMFDSCTSLTTAPELPATTLAQSCYSYMFQGCTSLTTAPALPATTLAGDCYRYMFYNCTSLTSAPALPATTLVYYCYGSMFYNCTSLTTAPELPATTLAQSCYSCMFGGCTSLTVAPALPATTLAYNCYDGMFQDCTSLTTAPELSATTLAQNCYDGMFQDCTSLTTAPELPATTLEDYCYRYMFDGCTSLTVAPELPATTLAQRCYSYMFYGCTGLTTAPALPATTLADYCYSSMFSYCTSLTVAPALPATTLANHCYDSMFRNCTGLTTAPELPATTLADYCCYSMFYNCTSLKLSATQTDDYTQEYRIPTSGTGATASSALDAMFTGTGGTFTGTPTINTTYYLHKDCSIV